MADYTPTTEQVRDVYHLGLLNAGPSVDVEAALAQFDRWLAAHDAEVCADLAEQLATAQAVIAEVDEYLDAIQKPDYLSLQFAINGIAVALDKPRDQMHETQAKINAMHDPRAQFSIPVIQIPTPHNAIAQEVLICGANDWMIEDETPHM